MKEWSNVSRSYRKNPIIKDNKRGSKTAKAHANRIFHRCNSNDELRTGKSAVHRKFTESWNIHDYVSRWTRSKAEREWEYMQFMKKNNITSYRYSYFMNKFKTKDSFMNYWAKCARIK